MSRFKPGDKVRRDPKYMWSLSYEKAYVINYINDEGYLVFDGIAGNWRPKAFILVESQPEYPCIKEIPPVPARKEIVPGPLFQGSFIHIEKHSCPHHTDKPYWLHQPAGGMSAYFNRDDLAKLRDSLTEIIKVIDNG